MSHVLSKESPLHLERPRLGLALPRPVPVEAAGSSSRSRVEPIDIPSTQLPASLVARVSDDTLRLAVHLLNERRASGKSVLLFTGVTVAQSVEELLFETALALLQLQERPLLVLHLEDAGSGVPPSGPFATLPAVSVSELANVPPHRQLPGKTVPGVLSVTRVIVDGPEDLAFLASAEFSRSFGRARQHHAEILCGASAVPQSVTPLVLARQCDGVVLVVPSKRTTMTEVVAARSRLARAHAHVMGFVMAVRGQKQREGAHR